jgi:hypothetical protein
MFRAKGYGKGKRVSGTFASRELAEAQMLAWIDAGFIAGSVGPVKQ